MKKFEFNFDDSSEIRLDQYLSSQFEDKSRSYVKKLISDSHVLVNGSAVKASRVLRGGEKIEVTLPPEEALDIVAENIDLDILFEDSSIVVINKAAGMVVHPAPGHTSGTLVNALLAHCRDLSGIGGVMRPGIVHRLDAGTTGIIIAAKNDKAHMSLSQQFQSRTIDKYYLALVFGRLKEAEGTIDLAIGRDRKDRKKISSKTDFGREALTTYTVEKQWQDFSLLKVKIHTGRTHQIRVHLAHIGHPLVGDDVYAGKRYRGVVNSQMQKKARLFGRPALHSWKIGFLHPVTNEDIALEAPVPEDLRKMITMLGEPI